MYDLVIQGVLDDDRTFLTMNALNDKLGVNVDIFSHRKYNTKYIETHDKEYKDRNYKRTKD